MQIELSPQHIETILFEAQSASRRLHRRLGPSGHDLDDLCQDLLIDLLRRLPAYNPARGSLGGLCRPDFAQPGITNRATDHEGAPCAGWHHVVAGCAIVAS